MSRYGSTLVSALLAALLAVIASVPSSAAAEESRSIFDFSLEELLQVEVTTGTLTGSKMLASPVSLTTISSEDIRRASARTIYDLLEIYVPGATWLSHISTNLPSMRGIVVDRAYQVLVLVNGRNVNQKLAFGAITELGAWNFDDIKEIQVIRGPGSVTYGPGAIMGVINIITHDAGSAPDEHASVKYITRYNSRSASVSAASSGDDFSVYAYGSVARTSGIQPDFLVADQANHTVDYAGSDHFAPGSANAVQRADLFGDGGENPNIKTHLDLTFKGENRLWLRFFDWSENMSFNGSQVFVPNPDVGPQNRYRRDRRFTAVYENKHDFERIELESTLSFSSEEHRLFRPSSKLPEFIEPSNRNNFDAFNAEHQLSLRELARFEPAAWNKTALGFELEKLWIRPPWGKGEQDFRAGDSNNLINGPDSHYTNVAKPVYVGSGWDTFTYSFLGESEFELDQKHTFLASIRTDKNDLSETLISPRLALIKQLGKGEYLKAVVQHSKRLNTLGSIEEQHRTSGAKADSETIKSYELMYSSAFENDSTISLSTFYNDVEIIGWDIQNLRSQHKGDVRIYGAEIEGKLPLGEATTIAASHALAKQLDFKLAEGNNTSGISWADYSFEGTAADGSTFELHDSGNDLNNLPRNVTKFYVTHDFTEKLDLFATARIFWDYPGINAGLDMVETAAQQNGGGSAAGAQSDVRALRDRGLTSVNWTFDLSLRYRITPDVMLTAYAYNLFDTGKRHTYLSNQTQFSYGGRMFEEPQSFGLRLDYKF